MELAYYIYILTSVVALILCWNLGPLFYSLMLFNFTVDVLLHVGWLAQDDMRLKWAIIQAVYSVYILIIGNFFRSRFEAITVSILVAGSFALGMYPLLSEASSDWNRWVELTTKIMQTGSAINVGLITIVLAKSLYLYWRGHAVNDLVVNPRKRFLVPILLWSILQFLPFGWVPVIAEWLEYYRFQVASYVLVWGWIFFELKFFVQARYWRKKYG